MCMSHNWFSHSSVDGCLGCFHMFGHILWTVLLWTWMHIYLFEYLFLIRLNVYLGVEFESFICTEYSFSYSPPPCLPPLGLSSGRIGHHASMGEGLAEWLALVDERSKNRGNWCLLWRDVSWARLCSLLIWEFLSVPPCRRGSWI